MALLCYVWLESDKCDLGPRDVKYSKQKTASIFSLYLSVVSVSAQYTCYVGPGQKTKQCENPCCGARPDQYCCEKKEEEDNR